MNLLIVGATGLTGGLLLKKALSDSKVTQVITLGRRGLGFKHPKLLEILVDFNTVTEEILPDIDSVCCCLGSTIKKAGSQPAFYFADVVLPIKIAEIAKRKGAEGFVLQSSLGASAKAKSFYLKCKGEAESEIAHLNFKSFVILRPSLLVGPRTEFRFGEKIGAAFLKVFNPLLVGGLRKFRSIKAKNVAKKMLEEAVKGRPGISVIESELIAR